MVKLCIKIFIIINFFILAHSIEFDSNKNANYEHYDFNDLIQKGLTRIHYSRNLKNNVFNNISLNSFSKSNIDSALEYFLNVSNDSKCVLDVLYTFQSIRIKQNNWALRLFDSYGKPDSGILQGSFKWPGSYTECISVYAPPKKNSIAGNFHGKYCTLGPQISNPALMALSPSIGVCIPDTCDAVEVKEGIEKLFYMNEGALPFNATLACKVKAKKLSNPAIAVISLISIFCTLTALGSFITVAKYFHNIGRGFKKRSSLVVNVSENGEMDQSKSNAEDELLLQSDESRLSALYKKAEEFFASFCIFKNGAKLLNTNVGEGELLCIHGIRFLSMSWVILGHTYVFCFAEGKNLFEALYLIDDFFFQIIIQGPFSVDSFFVLSGFLLAYLSMREFAKTKGKISWLYFYIHRYLRLTPIYMIIMGFTASVYFYIGSGPFWPDIVSDPNCATSWWRNLIYINNFNGMGDQCMGWSWYLANDMQFFVISPLFLITLWRWPKIGYSFIAVFLLAHSLANFFITYYYDLPSGMVDFLQIPQGNANSDLQNDMFGMAQTNGTNNAQGYSDYFDKLYIKPYTRIGPYLIGFLTGYILFKRKMSNAPKHSWITLSIGWILATAVTLTVVYGLYHTHLSLIARSFYNAFNRTCWAMGLSWVIYVCLIGQGGFVNGILSSRALIPLSRLTYSAYLIHPLILMWYYSSLKAPLLFTHPTMVILFLGMLATSYAVSLPVTLIFESPVIGLEKTVRKSFQRKEPQ